MTADIKAVGTDDDLRGPVFLAVPLRKNTFRKREDLRCHVFSHTVCIHLMWAVVFVAFNSWDEVWWYTERQVSALCLLSSVCIYILCMSIWQKSGTERLWQEQQWEIIDSSLPNLFSGIVFSLHSHWIITQNEPTGEVCRINLFVQWGVFRWDREKEKEREWKYFLEL